MTPEPNTNAETNQTTTPAAPAYVPARGTSTGTTKRPVIERRRLRLDQIKRDDATLQSRHTTNLEKVDEYAHLMKEGRKFPPVTVYSDGQVNWLVDGYHRCSGAEQAELSEIECVINTGTYQDAQWAAYAANATNGLARSNADKSRALELTLKHPNADGMSNRLLAEHVGVSEFMVRTRREKSTAIKSRSDAPIPTPTTPEEPKTRTGRDGRTTNVVNIGHGKQTEDPLHDAGRKVQRGQMPRDAVMQVEMDPTVEMALRPADPPVHLKRTKTVNVSREEFVKIIDTFHKEAELLDAVPPFCKRAVIHALTDDGLDGLANDIDKTLHYLTELREYFTDEKTERKAASNE